MTYFEEKLAIWAANKPEADFLDLPEFVQNRAFAAWEKLDDLIIADNLPEKLYRVYQDLTRNLQI
jgi:hypothetical protein